MRFFECSVVAAVTVAGFTPTKLFTGSIEIAGVPFSKLTTEAEIAAKLPKKHDGGYMYDYGDAKPTFSFTASRTVESAEIGLVETKDSED